MKKKAVVLLITLGFITVIMLLVMQTVNISKSSLDTLMKIKEQNQLILYMKNFTNLLNKQNPDDIKKYFMDTVIPISDNKSGVNITVECKALDSRINLNTLLSCDKDECDEIIKRYAQEKELSDEEFFLALLKDTVHPLKYTQRASGSKISLDDKTFSEGCILNYTTIKQIEDRYFQQTRDPNIYNIKEDDFLDIFYLFDKKVRDENSSEATQKVSKLLGCYENDDECQQKFHNINFSLNKITNCAISENNQTIQTKYLIQCKVDLYKGDESHSIVFKYNLDKKAKKRVVSIDEFF